MSGTDWLGGRDWGTSKGEYGKTGYSSKNAGNKNPTKASTALNKFMSAKGGSYNKATDFAQVQQDMYTGFTQDGVPLEALTNKEFNTRYGKYMKEFGGNKRDMIWGGEGKSTDNEGRVNNTASNNEEETPIEPVVLSAGTSFNPDGWQLPYTPPVSPYAAPAAQDWGVWMFGSPFGGEGGLAYQPGSQEYLEQYIPQNVWGSAPGLSEGVMAELAPSTGGLLEV